MLKPAIDQLIDKTGNRYSLSILASKQARVIIAQNENPDQFKTVKPLTIAIDQIMDDEVELGQKK